MAQVTFNPITNGEGYCQSSNESTWSSARTTAGTATQDNISIYSAQTAGPIFNIIRAFLPFDTTSLPTNAVITAATLQLYRDDTVQTFSNVDTTTVNVVQTTQANTSSLVASDYTTVTFTDGGSFALASTSNDVYSTITLNATALGWIVKGGKSKLGVIFGVDLNNTTPTGINRIGFQSGTGTNKPILTVTYELPGNALFFSQL